jgi:hypothetical protein
MVQIWRDIAVSLKHRLSLNLYGLAVEFELTKRKGGGGGIPKEQTIV